MGAERPKRRATDVKPASSSIEVVAACDLTSEPVSLALRYWNTLRGGRAYPARDEIVPRDMGSFLRNVVVARVIDGGRDYEYRIAGDAFVQAIGLNFQGMRLSQVEAAEPDYGRATRAVYECVRNLGQPFALRGTVTAAAAARFSYQETIFFPLGKDGAVDHVLAAAAFTAHAADAAEMPPDAVQPLPRKDFVKTAAQSRFRDFFVMLSSLPIFTLAFPTVRPSHSSIQNKMDRPA